jgi:TolA-binding protein
MNAPHMDDDRVLSELGRRVATDLGSGASPSRSRRHEQAFADLVSRGVVRQPTQRFLGIAVAASLFLLLLVGIGSQWLWPRDGSLHHTYGETHFTRAGGWVLEGPAEGVGHLRFEGGSEFAVHHGSAVRVRGATTAAVDVALDRGLVDVHVLGNERTRWTVDTGPYSVTVVGTLFAVDWEPAKGELHVRVDEGVVRVHGEGLSAHGVEVTAGKQLRADASRGVVFLGPVGETAVVQRGTDTPVAQVPSSPILDGAAASETIPETGVALVSQRADTPHAVSPPSREAAPVQLLVDGQAPPSRSSEPKVEPLAYHSPREIGPAEPAAWLALYAAGDFDAAVSEARAIGIDGIVATASQDDLWHLADAARISGDSAIAVNSLMVYRERFADSDNAHTAAYLLGRLSLEELGDATASVQWFDTYLAEAPDGPLAEEALGRSILAHDRLGEGGKARAAAERYLDRFPDGTFAAIAGRVHGE